MDIKRGDMFWVKKNPYKPAIGNVQESDRPAIIVSNNLANKNGFTYEVVYLTTSPKKDLPTHVTIRTAIEVSTALCEQITTVSDEQIGRFIGKCTKEEMMAVEQAMLISLGIDLITHDSKPKKDEDTPEPETAMIYEIEAAKIVKELELYKQLYHDLLNRILNKS